MTEEPLPLERQAPGDWRRFTPKLVTALRGPYRLGDLRADLAAGATVAVVALPLAMALAIASGVRPEVGLVTAAVAGFIISALGGSRYQIGGPTGAFVVIVAGIIASQGVDGLIIATLMAGLLLVVAGLARFGTWIKYIPEPVVAGFTGGIAIIIAASQLRDFAGLAMPKVPADFFPKMAAMWAARASVSPDALAVAVGALAVILGLRRYAPRAPAYLIAVVLASATAYALRLPVETIGTRFGQLPAGFPSMRLPEVTIGRLQDLAPSAFTIAFLAGIESLLSAIVADGMTGRRHRSNVELVAQGLANIASGLFGGLPATGAIARTATNVRAGARSPVSGMTHATILGVLVIAGAPLAGHVPLAALAAILLVVAWSMSEPRKIVRILRAPLGERAVLITTLLLTVLADLTVAIAVGIVMASMIFMHRMAEATSIAEGSVVDEDEVEPEDQRLALPPGVEVFQLRGPLFFGAAAGVAEVLGAGAGRPRAVILRMSRVPVADATGVGVLRDFINRRRRSGARVILSGVREQPLDVLTQLGLGPDDGLVEYAANFPAAIAAARSA
jgi:SulP family sulfate permease